MKATEAKLLDFLKKSPQFVIPIYQRTYSWTIKQCQQLLDDILRAGAVSDVAAHFIGSVVYIEKGLYQVSSQSPLLVIDGQQRLTTMMLLLEALSRHLGDAEPVDGFSAKKIRNYYLLNPLEEGEMSFKLLLTQTDKDSLLSIVTQKPLPANFSQRIKSNFDFFDQALSDREDNVATLCKGIAKLLIVDVALSRDQDNPQLIFESMNSTGKALSQADLIRNFVLMGLETDLQTQAYNDYWRPMELAFGQEGYAAYFDSFMRHYLTCKTGEIPKIGEVYDSFKVVASQKGTDSELMVSLVAEIHRFAKYFCAMALGAEPDAKLKLAFSDLLELKVDVAYPLLLQLYDDYANGILSRDDFCSIVRLIEAYVFRRTVCALPSNGLNKLFAGFHKSLRKERYLESVQAHFMEIKGYMRFPGDEEFKQNLSERDLYSFKNCGYLFKKMENFNRKERVPVHEYTIEHILPQNENLSRKWRDDLGSDWQVIQEKWCHTLGNLTLTGYNSEYSDRPFSEKRDMEGGFKHSPLRLNEGIGSLDVWNVEAINARAARLAHKAVEVWSRPQLSEAVLAEYKKEETTKYSMSDYQHLSEGAATRVLFDALRQEIHAISPIVNEVYLKLYIAFKADTNFVDVVPLKSKLSLTLNMSYSDVIDPQGLVRDVSDIKRWGNGDVGLEIKELADIPYAITLTKQAFNKQIDD